MAAEWRSTEFDSEETILGHGKERIGKQVADFLNENKVGASASMVVGFQSKDPQTGRPLVHAILWYLK